MPGAACRFAWSGMSFCLGSLLFFAWGGLLFLPGAACCFCLWRPVIIVRVAYYYCLGGMSLRPNRAFCWEWLTAFSWRGPPIVCLEWLPYFLPGVAPLFFAWNDSPNFFLKWLPKYLPGMACCFCLWWSGVSLLGPEWIFASSGSPILLPRVAPHMLPGRLITCCCSGLLPDFISWSLTRLLYFKFMGII